MLTVILCDDNPTVLDNYKEKLELIKKKYHLTMSLYCFTSGKAMLFHMEDRHMIPDIIYLDILMKEENGIEIAKSLREKGNPSEIIFLTANPEFVFDSFEAMPCNYIVKDSISDARFEEIFLKAAVKAEKKSKDIFTCANNTEQKCIPFPDILYFEVVNRVVTVHYTGGVFSFYSKLEDVEEKLGKRSFIRVHRSFLVNILYLDELKKDHLILSNKESIPLGGTYAKHVKAAINQFFNYLM